MWGRRMSAEPGPEPVDRAQFEAGMQENEQLRADLARAEQAGHRAEMRFDLMMSAAKIGLWDMDVVPHDPVNMENEFRWSQEFRTMLGFRDHTDFPDKLGSWASRLHPDDAPAIFAAFGNHLNDKTGRIPYDVTYRLMLKDGSYRWFRAAGATSRDRDGLPILVAGSLRDIHDEKMLVETSQRQVEQLRGSSVQLSGVSTDLSQAVTAAVTKAADAARTIADLDASSEQIGAVVKLITGIASQTNLLALNATIEAARAGDAGRGFAVVANEVKELANETSRATDEIAQQVEGIRRQTGEAVQGIREIEVTVQALTATQTAIDELVHAQATAN